MQWFEAKVHSEKTASDKLISYTSTYLTTEFLQELCIQIEKKCILKNIILKEKSTARYDT